MAFNINYWSLTEGNYLYFDPLGLSFEVLLLLSFGTAFGPWSIYRATQTSSLENRQAYFQSMLSRLSLYIK